MFWALAITGVVTWGVFFFCHHKLSVELKQKPIGNIALMAAAVLAGLGFWYYFKNRFETRAGYENGFFVLEVKDPALEKPLIVHDPFTLGLDWTTTVVQSGRTRVKVRMLYVNVYDSKGNALVTFRSQLGALQTVPAGFEYYEDTDGPPGKRAQNIYEQSRLRELAGVRLLQAALDPGFLEAVSLLQGRLGGTVKIAMVLAESDRRGMAVRIASFNVAAIFATP